MVTTATDSKCDSRNAYFQIKNDVQDIDDIRKELKEKKPADAELAIKRADPVTVRPPTLSYKPSNLRALIKLDSKNPVWEEVFNTDTLKDISEFCEKTGIDSKALWRWLVKNADKSIIGENEAQELWKDIKKKHSHSNHHGEDSEHNHLHHISELCLYLGEYLARMEANLNPLPLKVDGWATAVYQKQSLDGKYGYITQPVKGPFGVKIGGIESDYSGNILSIAGANIVSEHNNLSNLNHLRVEINGVTYKIINKDGNPFAVPVKLPDSIKIKKGNAHHNLADQNSPISKIFLSEELETQIPAALRKHILGRINQDIIKNPDDYNFTVEEKKGWLGFNRRSVAVITKIPQRFILDIEADQKVIDQYFDLNGDGKVPRINIAAGKKDLPREVQRGTGVYNGELPQPYVRFVAEQLKTSNRDRIEANIDKIKDIGDKYNHFFTEVLTLTPAAKNKTPQEITSRVFKVNAPDLDETLEPGQVKEKINLAQGVRLLSKLYQGNLQKIFVELGDTENSNMPQTPRIKMPHLHSIQSASHSHDGTTLHHEDPYFISKDGVARGHIGTFTAGPPINLKNGLRVGSGINMEWPPDERPELGIFPFMTYTKEELKAGGLRSNFDFKLSPEIEANIGTVIRNFEIYFNASKHFGHENRLQIALLFNGSKLRAFNSYQESLSSSGLKQLAENLGTVRRKADASGASLSDELYQYLFSEDKSSELPSLPVLRKQEANAKTLIKNITEELSNDLGSAYRQPAGKVQLYFQIMASLISDIEKYYNVRKSNESSLKIAGVQAGFFNESGNLLNIQPIFNFERRVVEDYKIKRNLYDAESQSQEFNHADPNESQEVEITYQSTTLTAQTKTPTNYGLSKLPTLLRKFASKIKNSM